MTILVFGRSGQLATALADVARRTGRPLVCLGRAEVDVLDAAALGCAIDAARPSAIVNAAAYTAVDKAESDREAAFALNAEAPALMARACASRDLPFVHVSTDYVFDGTKAEPYGEDDPIGPIGVYGASKAAGEARVRDADPGAVVLRTAWVYSPGGINFVHTMLRLGRERDEVRVVDDQIGNPTYAPDIAEACLTIADHRIAGEGSGGVFHYAGAGDVTWYGFAAAIFAATRARGLPSPSRLVPITTAEYPTPARRPANSRLDCRRIGAVFGIAAKPWPSRLNACLDAAAA